MKFYPHVTDQMAHVAVAVLILLLFAFGGLVGCALAGLAIGLVREMSEAGGSRITLPEVKAHFAKRDPRIDLVFWATGGLIAGLIVLA